MGMGRCESGEHHYDKDKYKVCPHCIKKEIIGKKENYMILCDADKHHYDSNKYLICPHCNKIEIVVKKEREGFIRCECGGYYDSGYYDSCPHCEISLNTIFSPTRSSEIGVIAISDTLVAKVFKDKSDLEKESKNLQFANSINDLFVNFERNIFLKDNNLMIMERVFSLEFRAYEYSKKLDFFNKFKESMNELHKNGFVFRDIMTTSFTKRAFPNIILTHQGIRLLDAELSILATEVDEQTFKEYILTEKEEIDGYFKEYFLSNRKQ